MKKYPKIFAALSVPFIVITVFSSLTVKAETLPEEQEITTIDETFLQLPEDTVTDESLLQTPEDAITEDALPLEPEAVTIEEPVIPAPIESPVFDAAIEYFFAGYVAKGTLTEFSSDIIQVLPMYSLDGETWQECIKELEWDLHYLGTENPYELEKLQNQICLYDSMEPLKSYLAGTLNCFYLKLRITKENGITYDSQTAVIERESPQPIPEEFTLTATFAPSICIFERNPFRYYGKYQLTISADATPEEVAAFLPDTLPMEIQLQKENKQYATSGIIDCPVTWKSLSLPPLIAGESMTISDAAEEIIIPEGTLLSTPLGDFQLEESLSIEQDMIFSDEVMLVLNVVSKDENLTGVLSDENAGLKMAFDLKPTGAVDIQAYVFSDDKPEWTALPNLSLLEAVNAQPSTANSGYTFILADTQEPYRSYLAAKNAGDEIEPFFIGLKIKGGVYDDCQLILAWPDNYDIPPDLTMGGAGGNENNAGADNKNDSTPEGQRPDLPQNTENEADNKADPAAETITKPDTPAGGSSNSEHQPKQEEIHTLEQFYDSAQTPAAAQITANETAQVTANENSAKSPPAPEEPSLIGSRLSDSPSLSGENDTVDNKGKTDINIIEKNTHNNTEANNYKFPYKVTIAIIVFICIIIAAAKPTINGISKKIAKIFMP